MNESKWLNFPAVPVPPPINIDKSQIRTKHFTDDFVVLFDFSGKEIIGLFGDVSELGFEVEVVFGLFDYEGADCGLAQGP